MSQFFVEVTQETTRGFFRNKTEFVTKIWAVTTVQTRNKQHSFENCLEETRTPHLSRVQDDVTSGIMMFPVEQRADIIVLDRTGGNYGFANIIQKQNPVVESPVMTWKEPQPTTEIPTEITSGTVVKRTRRARNAKEHGSTSTPVESTPATPGVAKPDVPVPVPPATSCNSSWIGDSRDIG